MKLRLSFGVLGLVLLAGAGGVIGNMGISYIGIM